MAKILKRGDTYYLELEVALVREGEYVVAFCPALDLTAYAKTQKAADKAFKEVLNIFIEDTSSKGTLEKVLLGLGWKLQQKPFKYQPPQLRQRDRQAMRKGSIRVERRSIPITTVAA